MLDVAVAHDRFRFLGNEFLTWLWYVIESEPDHLRRIDENLTALELGNRLVVQNHRQQTTETVTIRGDEAGMEEGILALKKGALVAEINLTYRSGDQTWHFSLKGEDLQLSGLKVPQTAPVESGEDIEGAVIEKAALCQRSIDLIDGLYFEFLRLRLDDLWTAKVLPRMRGWIGSKNSPKNRQTA
jgi:hypothetical protein